MKQLSRPLLPTLAVTAPALLFAFAPLRSAEALSLEPIGRYASGIFDDSAAEIVAYDPKSKKLFVTNSADKTLDVLDISDPDSPALIDVINVGMYGDSPTSCAVSDGVVAVAIVGAPTKQDPGKVVFFNAVDGSFIREVTAGPLPDNLTFTPDGSKVLVANEGEPSDDYTVDPEGSVSIIDLSNGVENLEQSDVTTVAFDSLNGSEERLRREGIRIFGPGASAAQDLEPEFITVDPTGEKAYVTLQENNAIAIIDIASASLDSVVPLGYKFHFAGSNGIDSSNRDDAIDIRKRPVYGMYQPDAIVSFQAGGKTYLVTANEGDARDYDGFSEERRIKDFNGEPDDDDGVVRSVNNSLLRRYPGLLEDEELGRLRTTTASPFGVRILRDGSLDHRALFSYGARSFSILNDRGGLVYESGDEFEQLTAALVPDIFNSNNDETEADGRSDDKGPEPEGVTVGEIDSRTYAFITLERVGGIMVYDVTKPRRATFVDYVNTRLDAGDANAATAEDDLGPEGILFIPAAESPIGKPLLVVAFEVSGSTVIFEIK